MFCTWGLGFRVYIKTVYARRGGGISWYLKRGVGLHLVLDVQELGLLELNLGFEGGHDLLDLGCVGLRLRIVLEVLKARSLVLVLRGTQDIKWVVDVENSLLLADRYAGHVKGESEWGRGVERECLNFMFRTVFVYRILLVLCTNYRLLRGKIFRL